jgi:predicted MFS family arabinose efflux permease
MIRRVAGAYREAFAGLPAPLWGLAAAVFVHRSGTMVLPFLALYLTTQQGFSTAQAGLLLGCYGVGAGAGGLLGGKAADRWGPWRTELATLIGAGGLFLVVEHARGPWATGLLLGALALVAEAFRPANSADIAARTPPERLSQGFVVRRLAINLGVTFGPAVGGLLAAYSYRWLFWVDGLTCWAAALVLWRLGPAPEPESGRDDEARPLASPWRDGPFLVYVALTFALGCVIFQLVSTFPLMLRDVHGLSEVWIGLLFGLNALLILAFEMVLTHRLQGARPLALVALGSILYGVGLGALPFGAGLAFVVTTVLVWSAGEMVALPFLETSAATWGPVAARGRYLGVFTFAFVSAFAAGPAVGTWVYGRWGPEVLGVGVAVASVLVAVAFRMLGARQGSLRPGPPAPGRRNMLPSSEVTGRAPTERD